MNIINRDIFDQVVAYLEHHDESLRIKKMLYCMCTGRWERNPEFLSSINCYHFAEYVVKEINTHQELKEKLFELLKSVNKPQEYVGIAKIIYSALGQIYPDFHRLYSNDLGAQQLRANQPVEETPAAAESTPAALQFDMFELRQKVMSYSNPLRVKTMLHMILQPEEFLDQRKINQHLLDNLLKEFITKYPKISEVEELLSEAVELLEDVEEYGKAATGLIQSLMTVYGTSTKPVGMATV
jgi:hypothetical protein